MEKIKIKKGVLEEAQEIFEVSKDAFSLHSDPLPLSAIKETLADEGGNVVFLCSVNETTGKINGYIYFWIAIDEAQLYHVGVRKEDRGKGIASLLMKEGLLIAREKGCVLSTLEVRESNEAAIGLYKKYGYEQVAKRKNYYNNPDEAAVLMNKEM